MNINGSSSYEKTLEIFTDDASENPNIARSVFFSGVGGYEVTTFITATTTLEEFNKKTASIVGYKLENPGGTFCWTALEAALYEGNKPLACHIAKIGGEKIVNLVGCSLPLWWAKDVETARMLITCGAKVN